MKEKKLRIVPLGGLGEIGKNMTVFEYDKQILIVDTGIMFPENDMWGIDYIIPDFQYLYDKVDQVVGIIITHGHEDHTGAIHHVLDYIPAPIYATPLTRGLLEVKLKRNDMLKFANLNTINAGDTLQLGPFKIETYHVCHSIPDAIGLGITTPAGLVIHSGDYKFDHTPVDNWPTDFAKLGEFGGRGVLALLGDSTNASDPGWTPSEAVIDGAFEKVFREAKGRIIVASFASLISRMQQAANAAKNHGRKMAFVGTSMKANGKMARKLGYLDVSDDLIVPIEEALKMPPSKVVLMATGAQGEPSSIMGRLARDANRQFSLEEGDTVILSSHPIPGNEETVYRTINSFFRRGATVIYDPIAPVHVSGHASQEEIKLLIQMVKPKYLIPVHGELRHLHQHGELAQEVGIPKDNIAVIENGQVIEFVNGKMQLGERIPGGYVFVDGTSVGDIGPAVVREREQLSQDGFVLTSLVIDAKSKLLIHEPKVLTKGFVYQKDAEELIEGLLDVIYNEAEKTPKNLEKSIEQVMRTYLYNKTKRRPSIHVIIEEV